MNYLMLFLIIISMNVWTVLGNGEFTIHHSPNGINFKGNEPIDSSELPNILTTAMGISSNSVNISSI